MSSITADAEDKFVPRVHHHHHHINWHHHVSDSKKSGKGEREKKKKGPWVHWVDCSGNDCRDEWHKEGQMSEIAAKETKKNKMTKEK